MGSIELGFNLKRDKFISEDMNQEELKLEAKYQKQREEWAKL